MRRLLALLALTLATAAFALPVQQAQVVGTYPHDTGAFTEGLLIHDGLLYESTGLEGSSFIRKSVLATGKVVQKVAIPAGYFGEGIVVWGNRLRSFVWHGEQGFTWDARTLRRTGSWHYTGEGWAMTRTDRAIVMSDGTATLRFLRPDTMQVVRRLDVTADGRPVTALNELEYVDGEILANIWQTALIARIDPDSGHVKGWIDVQALWTKSGGRTGDAVPNGIAYDRVAKRLYVTGKNWPYLFEIRRPLQP